MFSQNLQKTVGLNPLHPTRYRSSVHRVQDCFCCYLVTADMDDVGLAFDLSCAWAALVGVACGFAVITAGATGACGLA